MSYYMPHPKNTRRVLLMAGIVAALFAEVGSLLIFRVLGNMPGFFSDVPGGYLVPLCLASPPAAALSSMWIWWRLIIKPGRTTVRWGIGAGVLSSIIAHPLTWWLVIFLVLVVPGWGKWPTSLSEWIYQLLFGELLLSLASLVVVGWLTALVGGVGGALLIFLQRKWFPLET